ncbi:MAG: SH3 domain-containing protein [Leptolyngbyaceae cyanobacterium SM2_5_2]|nr:SH3 domain-containing protein [Leptolyngbyaceae cyanobacterium SM2_5_2]
MVPRHRQIAALKPQPHPLQPAQLRLQDQAAGREPPSILPRRPQLIADQPESRINLRAGPSTAAEAKGYGLVGDPVQLLRSTKASDGTWYYVKFEQSGAEGWIRGDFINIEGRAKPLGDRVAQSNECEGLMESVVFTAYYDANGFHLVRFTNLETQSTFDSPLSRQGSNTQGQPVYTGSASPPHGRQLSRPTDGSI